MAQAQETAEYIVTKAAPPRVAGRPAKPGQILPLTELQARSELLAGAIVPKADDRKDGDPAPSGEFETSDELVQIRARAKGYKGAIATAPAEKPSAPAADKVSAGSDPVAQGMSTAAGAATSSSTAATVVDGKADAGAPASDAGTVSDGGKRPGKTSAASTGA